MQERAGSGRYFLGHFSDDDLETCWNSNDVRFGYGMYFQYSTPIRYEIRIN